MDPDDDPVDQLGDEFNVEVVAIIVQADGSMEIVMDGISDERALTILDDAWAALDAISVDDPETGGAGRVGD